MSHRRTLILALAIALLAVPAADAHAAKRIFGDRTLTVGSHGRDVRVLQDYLTRWGLRTTVDGQYGRRTARRVRSWERRADRRVDGRMTKADARVFRASVERGERRADAPRSPTRSTRAGEGELDTGAGGTSPSLQTTSTRTTPKSTTTTDPAAASEKATLLPDGTAVAPASAPPEVHAIIAAGNKIHDLPYRYGGGHGRWKDTGYDCSGSMSYVFHAAGMLDTALTSGGFAQWGDPGPGTWITTYGNAGHSFMVVAGLRFDTSGRAHDNSRWDAEMRSSRGYTVRHPPGL